MLQALNAVRRIAARHSEAPFEFALAVSRTVRESWVLPGSRCKAPKSQETGGMQHLRPGNEEFNANMCRLYIFNEGVHHIIDL